MLLEEYAGRVTALYEATQAAVGAAKRGEAWDAHLGAILDAERAFAQPGEPAVKGAPSIESPRDVSLIRWQSVQHAFKAGWKACDRLVIDQEGSAALRPEKRPKPNAARVGDVYRHLSELRALLEAPTDTTTR